MKQDRIDIGRRGFLKAGSLSVVSAAIAGSVDNAAAQAQRRSGKSRPQVELAGAGSGFPH